MKITSTFFALTLLLASGVTCLQSSETYAVEQAVSVSTPIESPQIAEEEPEPVTIKTIMQVAHKKGLLKKVATGQATAEEREQLLKHYTDLAALKPPRGDQDGWNERTGLMMEAARAAVASDPTAPSQLKSTTNCASCHDEHK